MSAELAEHFFRHEYGKLVGLLVRRWGVARLDLIEDAVQAALVTAVESWPRSSVPDNPTGWLYRVAHFHVGGEVRRHARRSDLAQQHALSIDQTDDTEPSANLAGDLGDEVLLMLFVGCDGSIPLESQVVLALKVLCGFSVPEIADRLFTTEANVYKRLGRARERLRSLPLHATEVTAAQMRTRLGTVHLILYTLFAEGHLSYHPTRALRVELCDEAIRLCEVLAEHPAGATPETHALLALMHLHRARMAARQDACGGLLLLEEQHRDDWDAAAIGRGLWWLERSAQGDTFSRYHAEAAIAAEHCLAPSLGQTNWNRVVECYEMLEHAAPSVLHRLNRALAVAEWRGPKQGLAVLDGVHPPPWLTDSYLWSSVLSDLHRRAGHAELARTHRQRALAAAPSQAIREALERRLRVR